MRTTSADVRAVLEAARKRGEARAINPLTGRHYGERNSVNSFEDPDADPRFDWDE
jgi:hypothetical protein